MLVWVNSLPDLFLTSVRIIHQLLVNLLIAKPTQSSRMVRPVLVRALGRLRLIAIGYITLVAHELCPVLSIVVGADLHQFEVFLYTHVET